MSFYPELREKDLEGLKTCFQSPAPKEEEATAYYQEVAHLIASRGEEGRQYLARAVDGADQPQLRGIIFGLGEGPDKNPLSRDILFRFLRDERPLIVAEAIDGLRNQGYRDVLDVVLPLYEHPSPYVKGSVLRFVASQDPTRANDLLFKALKDPSFIVRENAADELGELRQQESIELLRPLLEDPHPHVRQAAESAIETIRSAQDPP